MNKIGIMMVIMTLLLVSAVHAIGGAQIKASVLRYEPTPAEQGNTVDVWVQLNNIGTKADSVAIKFVPEYPFSLPEKQQEEIDIGTLAGTESKVVKFTVLVDPNAPNGERNIKFLYEFSSANEWTQLEAPLTIETHNAVLVVADYKVMPSPVVPGQTATVDLHVRNAGKVSVKNVDVGIGLADGTFNTINSGAKKRIDSIAAGETEIVRFQLASDTSTQIKVYSIPVMLSYADERNKQYSDTTKISLVVNAQPEIALSVDATKFDDKKSPGTVSLKVVNKGVVNVKYVTVRLATSKEYELLSSSNETYVGNLDSDDFRTVDFVIKPLVTSPQLQVQIEFKDQYNGDFKQAYTLPLRIITDKDLGKQGSSGVMAFVVLVIIGGIVYWRVYNKKKR